MITMAQNPDDVADQIEQAYKMAPPVSAYAAPVDPHATLTAPISPAPPELPMMAAPKETGSSKMSTLKPQEDRASQRLMADYRKDADPYGSPDNHPSFGGKLLHGLGVAGDVIAPHTMARIPGTQLNRQAEEQGLEKELQDISKEESTENLQGAQAGKETADTAGKNLENQNAPEKFADEHAQSGATTENLQSETNARNNPQPSLASAYAHAVNEALKNGRDPSTDPIVQHISDAITSIQPEHTAAQGQPKPVQVNGKSTFAIETPNGWVDAQSRQPIQGNVVPIPPQPNYGQLILPTKTTTVIPDSGPYAGIPVQVPWNEQTHSWDTEHPIGVSASNAYGHEAAQAGAVNRAGEQLINDIQANRQRLGTLSSWVQKYGLNTPIADPQLAGLQAELRTFSALQPAMHGFRSHSALEAFNKIIGDLQKNPDATIASIQGILKTAGNINPGLNHSGGNEPPRPANVPASFHFDANGSKGAGWYKPKAKQ